jgi:SAM-dependent methyltransferase
MKTILDHPDVVVRIEENGTRKRLILVEAKGGTFVPVRSWETAYPIPLIEHVLKVKGVYVADEIMRDEGPLYVQHSFKWNILSYVDTPDFAGRRVLDFGCGSGASTTVLARMLPESTQLVGVELIPEYVELACHRAQWYGIEGRAVFHLSPDPTSLPQEIGQFDYVVFSAVYEHLLPLLWRHLKPNGILFLDQTPYRWFPFEMHTTGLPLINYLPDRLAHKAACRFSKRIRPDETWPDLLRKGIRGGTVREVLGILNQEDQGAELLRPSRQGVRDHIDLWFQLSSTTRAPLAKKLIMWGFRAVKATTGVTMIPSLSLAIQKVK